MLHKFFNKTTAFAGAAAILFIISIAHCVKIHSLENQLKNSRLVYVYDVEKVLASSPQLAEVRQNYEEKINQLSVQVQEAVEKLNKMKDKKAKEEYSEVYLNTLTLKRNDLVEQYQQEMKKVGEKINAALIETANRKNVNAVFFANSIALKTADVDDITQDVINAVK